MDPRPGDDDPHDEAPDAAASHLEDGDDGDDLGEAALDDELEPDDDDGPRRTALPRRVESWRARSMTGAVMSAMAMGLQQVFAPEKEKPAIVAEAPSDPYGDDDPVIVDYVADDASGTTVTLRPWLLPGAAAGEEASADEPATRSGAGS